MEDSKSTPAFDQERRFIRHQAWCECERSCNVSTGSLEKGVSAYECRSVSNGIWEPTGRAFDALLKKYAGQERGKLGGFAPWYLVSGRVVGDGSDGEPLLKDVNVHATLCWDGSQYFEEGSPRDSVKHDNHPNYPDCTCTTVSDSLIEDEATEGDEAIEWGDADEARAKYRSNAAKE